MNKLIRAPKSPKVQLLKLHHVYRCSKCRRVIYRLSRIEVFKPHKYKGIYCDGSLNYEGMRNK